MTEENLEKLEVDLFVEALYRRYGYDFRGYAKASVRRRVRHLLAQTTFSHISDMIGEVLHNEQFAHKAIYDFSITVTEMFRDPGFYRVLREKITGYLQTFPFIKIWVAGCATGEEVYSLAIVLKEQELYDRATIFATDFNAKALETAKKGLYPLKAIQQYTANYQKSGGCCSFGDYYHAQNGTAIMNPALASQITFANHNLVTDGVFGEMHMILCRNVLIYFDKALQNKVLHLLQQSLAYGGFLCLGTKESLRFSTSAQDFKTINDEFRIYQKSAMKMTNSPNNGGQN
ncbi:MAG: protein-glutamate O-methyltransferase CheR [Anaerolineae bacterium]|nr:protein-glutamate O-methyltransferase CheR [Anaerolineae bacterium]